MSKGKVPLICNGGPELWLSDSDVEPKSSPLLSPSTMASGETQQQQTRFAKHVQVRNYAEPNIMGSGYLQPANVVSVSDYSV